MAIGQRPFASDSALGKLGLTLAPCSDDMRRIQEGSSMFTSLGPPHCSVPPTRTQSTLTAPSAITAPSVSLNRYPTTDWPPTNTALQPETPSPTRDMTPVPSTAGSAVVRAGCTSTGAIGGPGSQSAPSHNSSVTSALGSANAILASLKYPIAVHASSGGAHAVRATHDSARTAATECVRTRRDYAGRHRAVQTVVDW